MRGPRAILLTALALGVAVASPLAETARGDVAQVTVVSPGGAERTLSLDALAGGEDVVGREYVLRSDAAESVQTVTGFSPAALLEAAGVDPYAFSYMEVQRPAGGSVLLSRDQALDSGAFADGPPVVYATAAGTGFLRPSSGPEDLNAADSFEAPQGIALVLRRGSPLRVRARASTVRTRPGRPVAFSAIVDRAGAGEQLTYSWYFDDGHSATGPGVRHRFAKRGSYDVVVGVTAPGDEAGASAVVTVQVGPPLAGPDRKGGGTNEDASAPDHGAATGDGAAGDAAGAPTPTPTPASPADARSRPQQAPTRARERAPQRQQTRTRPQGEVVSGQLLSSTAPPPPSQASVAPARTGKLDDDSGAGTGLPDAAIGLLLTTGLLGLGALAELRSPFVGLFTTNSERGRLP
jgi:hypothetical protein